MMSVNISARQFWRADLLNEIEEAIQNSGIEPGMLQLEITETMILHDTQVTHDRLASLRKLGVGVALDDFGTGYSALNHLRTLPIDTIKIDRSFVSALESDPKTAAIVRSVTALAKELGMHVIAEGVETAAQMEQVRAVNCEWAQGYLIARPLEAGAMADLLAAARRAA